MKKFISNEALSLRYTLEFLALYHLFNVLFINISLAMKLIDILFLLQSSYGALKLDKKVIIAYVFQLFIVFCVGVSHFQYPNNFRTTFLYFYYINDTFTFAIGALCLLQNLKSHIVLQHSIRLFNQDQKSYLRSKFRKRFESKFKDAIKSKIQEIILDNPDETQFFAE